MRCIYESNKKTYIGQQKLNQERRLLMKKALKKLLAGMSVIAATAIFLTVPVLADSVKTNFNSLISGSDKQIKVKSVKYDLTEEDSEEEDDDDDLENVEIKFATKVKWSKKAKALVTNEKAEKLAASIEDKDSDDCDLYIEGLEQGHTYTISLEGIKAKKAKKYGNLTVSFTIPAPNTGDNTGSVSSIKIKSAEYDEEDRELELEFAKKVKFSKDASIVLLDQSGKQIDTEICDTDSDECTIEADLEIGEKYYFTIKGIKTGKETKFGQVSGTFLLEEDD